MCPISFTYPSLASMWVVTHHRLFLYSDPPQPCHPPSYWLRVFSSQTFSRIIPRHFSNLIHSSHLPAYEDGTDTVFRNVGIYNSEAGELPRRKHKTFGTERKFEIKSIIIITSKHSTEAFQATLVSYFHLYLSP